MEGNKVKIETLSTKYLVWGVRSYYDIELDAKLKNCEYFVLDGSMQTHGKSVTCYMLVAMSTCSISTQITKIYTHSLQYMFSIFSIYKKKSGRSAVVLWF